MSREPFVKLKPAFKDYLWGGKKLKALYGAKDKIVAEAWLVSAHPDGPSVVAEGKFEGMPFPDYLKADGAQGNFPVLIKFIDSAQKLSVQVHPDDAYARLHENDSGKSEMWIVLEADAGAYLYVGFNRDVTKEEVRRRVEDGTIEEVLGKVPTHAGDIVNIPAGTVHAIGAGNLILEVQQSSNATYRLYDYMRRDSMGSLRPLHVDKALDVLDCRRAEAAARSNSPQGMQCPYFSVEKHAVNGSFTLPMADERFAAAVCITGEGALKRQKKQAPLRRGDSVYLPAGASPAEFTGEMILVVIRAALLTERR
ncbi:MAG: class I mannose-6-phosphate isomerase [Clostridiales bacterium]|nr:class I mannose-6-phosphate isomerase [Clostridiales bacterium]